IVSCNHSINIDFLARTPASVETHSRSDDAGDELHGEITRHFIEAITPVTQGLESAQIEQFITDGFVRLDRAFPRELANAARAILWRETGCDPDDPATWTQPVIRLGMFTQAPFIEAANTPRLHAAFDQLVGRGRWRRPEAMGTFPVRFPPTADPGDAGWHIDVSFGTD